MEDILLPSKVELIPGENDRIATFVVEPCFHGYGTTLGNALRRVMLSSLPGAAVTAVKISGATHEFSSLAGVKEDVLEIILNLKALRLRMFGEGPVRLTLRAKGERAVTGADIDKNSEVEIVNPDMHIAELTDKKAELEMDIIIERGRGFSPVEERGKEKNELGIIAVDAVFSPVRDIGFRVENVRVGQITNFDKLVMTIETDGTLSPGEAVDQSLKVLLDHFVFLQNRGKTVEAEPAVAVSEEVPEDVPAEVPSEDVSEDASKKKKVKKASKKK